TTALVLESGDWPELRGPGRLGEYHGPAINVAWSTKPPPSVWQRRIGPAWSSLVIVGGYLFTQEQRGEDEAVVALDAATGHERWSHVDSTRFYDGQGGAGPRATPTFDAGKLYSLGATGVLNCLDAATGSPVWQQNIAKDSGASAPMWGFSSSPLVVDGVVVVYAGGETGKELLGYDAATGRLKWTAEAGPISYSSGQVMRHEGRNLVLFVSDRGLAAIEPATGKIVSEYVANSPNIWRAVQPRPLDDGGVLFGSEDLGLVLVGAIGPGASSLEPRWTSRAMKPAYNDFVIQDGSIYGFDDAVFECVDLASGKRRWRGGRFGHGQVLLLVEQKLLLVISESGAAVLVAARPDKLEELGRFQAVTGKTWNHPTIAHGRLFVRNDEEIACYDVAASTGEH
ncbi:MAG TPA: PQQ-binding-like beta-propeller repeat protein, partial [Pirellulales bacterium]|nr:PQQ-binding-like beta-propeller repeat protein [Pirellulales bacterium]